MFRPRGPSLPTLRNGLKWRDGRPRWEPSPASRAAGIGGMDLKDAAGAWMDRGPAIAVADARARWAGLVREAAAADAAGDDARAALRAAIDNLPASQDAADRHRRALLDDLIRAARERLGAPPAPKLTAPGARTVEAMITGYFAAVDASDVEISVATRKNYWAMVGRIRAKFDGPVGEITRGGLRSWYVELRRDVSTPTANLALGAFGAFLRWAAWQDWIPASPATKLGRTTNPRKHVIWTLEEEQTFVPWCDANGYADVGDAVTLGLWTAARPNDMCLATLEALQQPTWRFVPHKGQRRGREVNPVPLEPVRARVRRRLEEVRAATVRAIGPARFLASQDGGWHTSGTLGDRFRDARAAALLADKVPETLQGKQLRHTRSTCVTRLYLSDVTLDRIPGWTGHAPNDRDEILREHYLALLDEASLEDAEKLKTWTTKQGLML